MTFWELALQLRILDDEKQILISAPPLKAKNYDFTKAYISY